MKLLVLLAAVVATGHSVEDFQQLRLAPPDRSYKILFALSGAWTSHEVGLTPLMTALANRGHQHTLTLTNQTHIELTALILEAYIAALDKRKKIGDILSRSLQLNFDIVSTFPDRDSTAIFNFYYDKTDSQHPQTTQPETTQDEHTIDQTIDTAMDKPTQLQTHK
ncbi:hypothetical protein FHG87_000045 [Trinorchestia longiramus]|nr:hypothetical protein FHG87_000045 [Trinorchestia longiramus]